MNLRLCDLHCDTILETYKQGLDINHNDRLHISLDKSGDFSLYTQVFAIWSRHGDDPETLWSQFFAVKASLDAQLSPNRSETAKPCDPYSGCNDDDKADSKTRPGFTYVLAMEGGSPINGDLSRLDELYKAGVRILTPVWSGEDAIGGAYNTNVGLTAYGRSLVKRCLELGIAPDVSHASDRMTAEIIELCAENGFPALASHSNSRSVYGYPRGLTDENFLALAATGGVAAINFVPEQLHETGRGLEYAVAHIERFIELGGESRVALGCDFDGTDSLPDGVRGIGDLYKLAEKLGQYNYSDTLIDRIFYANGRKYLERLLS
jgi:Zn-dependent dipeptidase, microsomal dipeptidase homolog